jgi:molybdopterin synthase catalytic subunit
VRLEVLYFAVVRERSKRDGDSLILPDGATVGDALVEIGKLRPEIAPLLPRVQAAVNRSMVTATAALADGDELALIPPVAGGAGPRRIAVSDLPLSLDEVVSAVTSVEQGAIATFTGCVRRKGQLDNVKKLEYEAFVPMAVAVLTAIADEIEHEQPGVRLAIHHRTGTLALGEAAVVIAASAPHRAPAFEACRAAIERLKERAPIWKKEVADDGAVWVGLGP